jgi:hypothetical protein
VQPDTGTLDRLACSEYLCNGPYCWHTGTVRVCSHEGLLSQMHVRDRCGEIAGGVVYDTYVPFPGWLQVT